MTSYPLPQENHYIIGQQQAEKIFLEGWKAQRLSHAIIFNGPRGVGKATMAFHFARLLLKPSSSPLEDSRSLWNIQEKEDSFNQIKMATDTDRLIAQLAHPDLLYINKDSEDKKTKKTEIVVDDIRQIKQFIQLTPSFANWKVVIIDCADDLNRAAANALLKVLEDPPPYSLIILVTHHIGRLLKTVRSRCQKITFEFLSKNILNQLITRYHSKPINDQTKTKIIELAEGSIGRAVALLEEGVFEQYILMCEILEKLPELSNFFLQQLIDKVTNFSLITELLLSWVYQQSRNQIFKQISANKLSPNQMIYLSHWEKIYQKIADLLSATSPLHLDAKQSLMNIFITLSVELKNYDALDNLVLRS